jgi:CRISPR system Cascade subunit CasD
MPTLLLRLAGPMQSWGTQSRFSVRDTGLEPSKSGVVGLLCSALGWPRSTDVTQFTNLRMGVRVDKEGILLRDYHTVLGIAKADGKIPPRKDHPKYSVTSSRYYLSDAAFLVGLEGDCLTLLRQCHDKLARPEWPLFLGRKAFPPGENIWLREGFHESVRLEEALSPHAKAPVPWEPRPGQGRPDRLRVVLEDPEGAEVRSDQPVGVAFETRRFTLRRVRTVFWEVGYQVPPQEATP